MIGTMDKLMHHAQRAPRLVPVTGSQRTSPSDAGSGPLLDTSRRPLRDLRISITDRCNFRCTYCVPREILGPDHVFLPRASPLTVDECARFARIAVAPG